MLVLRTERALEMGVEESYMLNIFIQPIGSAAQIREKIDSLIASRSPRRVVTPSGRRMRGYFPSLKAVGVKCRFESGLELRTLQILEVSTLAKQVKTHPYVLDLSGFVCDGRYYTPDLEIITDFGPLVVEVKGVPYLRGDRVCRRYKQISEALKKAGIPFLTVLSCDLDGWEWSEAVTQLLKDRPWPKHGGRSAVPDSALHLYAQTVTPEFRDRWQAAGKECDALLARLMKRGPDETIAAAR